MDIHNLVEMANQIGHYFESYPDRAEARAEIAAHINRFWEPRMRKAIVAHLAASGAASGLDELVREAVERLEGSGTPA